MLAHNPILHNRAKNNELNLFFEKEIVMEGKLLVAHIPSTDQPIDVLTKAVSKAKFWSLREKLHVTKF
ncbi:hypothetical protein AHAS_Ahas18G0145100 [Arachis hypogaea]